MYPNDPQGTPRLAAEQPEGKGRKSRRGKKPKQTGSAKRRDFKIPLIFAIVLGVLATLIIIGSLGAGDDDGEQMYTVRAAQDITAWVELTEADLEAVPVDLDEILPEATPRNPGDELFIGVTPEAALSEVALGDSIYTRQPVRAGQLLYKADLAQGSIINQTLSGVDLTGPDRIVTIEALPASAAGGRIQPGDRVDIIAADSTYELGRVVLEDIPVLYVDLAEDALESIYSTQSQEPGRAATDLLAADPFPGIYALAVPADRADELALLDTRGQTSIVLALRHGDSESLNDTAVAEGDIETADEYVYRTISVLEAFCPPELLENTEFNTGEDVGGEFDNVEEDDSETSEEEPEVVELPSTCVRELLRVQEDIAGGTDPFGDGTEFGGQVGVPEDAAGGEGEGE